MKKFLIASALVIGFPVIAAAATLQATTNVRSFDINDNVIDNDICFDFSSNTSQAQCLSAYAIPGSSSSLNYDATAQADYGVLKVFGQSSIDLTTAGSGGPEYITTTGTAFFRDQWTITGEPAGSTGTLELSFDLTGSYDFSMVETGLQFGFSLINFTGPGPNDSDNTLPPATGLLTTTFTFGDVLDFQVNLTGGSVLYDLSAGGYDGQTSFLDLSNTAVMDAIVVKDIGGTIVPFNLATTSGAPLFEALAPTPVPVPAAAWLLGSGLLGLFGFARKRAG